MKKKVLFIYDSMVIGGTTTALLSLLNSIDQDKYEISLLLYTNDGELINDIPRFVRLLMPAYVKTKVNFLTSSRRKILRTIINGEAIKAVASWWKYRGTAKGKPRLILMHHGMRAQVALSRKVDEHYDVAISFMEGWAAQYVMSKKIKAERKYIWIHPQYQSCYLLPEIDRPIFQKATGIVLVSEDCRIPFLSFFPEFSNKLYVIPNIVSSSVIKNKAFGKQNPIKKGRINFCTVCRCDMYVKGLDRLLDVFCTLKEEGRCQNIKWHYIGAGIDFDIFRSEVKKREMSDTIVLYGNQLNPLPYLCEMDAFILASRYEGKPIAVTEAQIMGLPCLVTNYESASSQVQHEFNGMIMDNNYKSIYETVKAIIQNPFLLDEWKQNTRLGVYSNEHDVEKIYSLLDTGDI